jgi:hypothetical protein
MTEDEYRAQLNVLEERLADVYRERRKLTEEFAEEHPAVLPAPRWQSDMQQRVARCPRCGLSQESGVKK